MAGLRITLTFNGLVLFATVAELAYAQDLGSCGATLGSSSLPGRMAAFPTPRQAEGLKGGRTEGDFRLQILDFRLLIVPRTNMPQGVEGQSEICNLHSEIGSPALIRAGSAKN